MDADSRKSGGGKTAWEVFLVMNIKTPSAEIEMGKGDCGGNC